MYFRTSDDVNGGVRNLTASCKEYTLLVTLTFMESKFRSLYIWSKHQYLVVISRGANRHVDELRFKDPEYSPGRLAEADSGSKHAGN